MTKFGPLIRVSERKLSGNAMETTLVTTARKKHALSTYVYNMERFLSTFRLTGKPNIELRPPGNVQPHTHRCRLCYV